MRRPFWSPHVRDKRPAPQPASFFPQATCLVPGTRHSSKRRGRRMPVPLSGPLGHAAPYDQRASCASPSGSCHTRSVVGRDGRYRNSRHQRKVSAAGRGRTGDSTRLPRRPAVACDAGRPRRRGQRAKTVGVRPGADDASRAAPAEAVPLPWSDRSLATAWKLPRRRSPHLPRPTSRPRPLRLRPLLRPVRQRTERLPDHRPRTRPARAARELKE
jgi:hypothetical protein